MTWFRADDRLSASRKVLSIRRGVRLQAMGLWVLAGTWSAGEELDGFVPDYMVEELGGSDDVAAALVASGLWADAEGGWQFTKWAEYQPSRLELEERRDRERERKADWRARKAAAAARASAPAEGDSRSENVPLGQAEDEVSASQRLSRGTSGGTDEGTESGVRVTSALTRPDPTRPDPTPITSLSSEVAIATVRPEVEELLDLLDSEIARNGGKVRQRTQKNRDAIRLMLDRDGIDREEVAKAIRWAQADDFWRANILSGAKLREKFDQLRLAAQRKRAGGGQAAPTRTESNLDFLRTLEERERGEQGDARGELGA